MKRGDILKKIAELERNRTTGKLPLLYEKNFRNAFVKAILESKGNGSRIHRILSDDGFDVSYKTVQEYVRRVLGRYPIIGRPPKYMKSHERKGVV